MPHPIDSDSDSDPDTSYCANRRFTKAAKRCFCFLLGNRPFGRLMGEVTRILQTMGSQGEAADQLLPLVYEELHKLAAHKMTGEAPGQTLQATALVHEAYLRLVRSEQPPWQSQAHFFAPAGEAMRRILIDNALMSGHPCVVIPHDGSDVCLAFVGPGDGRGG